MIIFDMQLFSHVAALFLGLGLILCSELIKKRDTVNKYKKDFGENSWKPIVIKSIVAALVFGLISSVVNSRSELKCSYLITFVVAIIGYVSVQALYTDIKLYLIDRYVLRIAYVANFFASLGLIFTNNFANNDVPLFATFVIVLLALFFIISTATLGTSDIRSMAVTLPISSLLFGGEIAFGFYIGLFLFMYVYQTLWSKYKKRHMLYPVGPMFLIPYLPLFAIITLLR